MNGKPKTRLTGRVRRIMSAPLIIVAAVATCRLLAGDDRGENREHRERECDSSRHTVNGVVNWTP